jgi:hypothetical protein
MSALVLANFPIAFLIFAAIVGIPLWLTFKRPDRAPRYSEARANGATTVPAVAASTRPAVTARVSLARQHAAARTAVPGRQHAAAARDHAARDHAARGHAAVQHDHAAA